MHRHIFCSETAQRRCKPLGQAGLIQRATNKVICFCCGDRAIRASMPAALLHDPDAWIMPRSRHSLQPVSVEYIYTGFGSYGNGKTELKRVKQHRKLKKQHNSLNSVYLIVLFRKLFKSFVCIHDFRPFTSIIFLF